MEVVAKTEYQDIYRLKYGTLLVVDKFERIYPDNSVTYHGKNRRMILIQKVFTLLRLDIMIRTRSLLKQEQ